MVLLFSIFEVVETIPSFVEHDASVPERVSPSRLSWGTACVSS